MAKLNSKISAAKREHLKTCFENLGSDQISAKRGTDSRFVDEANIKAL